MNSLISNTFLIEGPTKSLNSCSVIFCGECGIGACCTGAGDGVRGGDTGAGAGDGVRGDTGAGAGADYIIVP